MSYFLQALLACVVLCCACLIQGFTSAQVQLVDENHTMVQHREHEISQIVRSIQDLNDIFKDLAHMIVDQVGGWMLFVLYFLFSLGLQGHFSLKGLMNRKGCDCYC